MRIPVIRALVRLEEVTDLADGSPEMSPRGITA